jgi:hypothetical protein
MNLQSVFTAIFAVFALAAMGAIAVATYWRRKPTPGSWRNYGLSLAAFVGFWALAMATGFLAHWLGYWQ